VKGKRVKERKENERRKERRKKEIVRQGRMKDSVKSVVIPALP